MTAAPDGTFAVALAVEAAVRRRLTACLEEAGLRLRALDDPAPPDVLVHQAGLFLPLPPAWQQAPPAHLLLLPQGTAVPPGSADALLPWPVDAPVFLAQLDALLRAHRQRLQLHTLAADTFRRSGEDLFESCARFLAEELDATLAVIAETTPGQPDRLQTLACHCRDGGPPPPLRGVRDTPCAQVLEGAFCYYLDGVHRRFAHLPWLAERGLRALLAVPILDEAGAVGGLVAAAFTRPLPPEALRHEALLRLIAARSGAELARERDRRALHESERRNRIIAELISDYAYIFRVNPDGSLVGEWVTESFTRDFGYTLEQVRARGGWLSLVLPEDQPKALAHARKVVSGRTDVVEMRWRAADGSVRWLRDYAQPVRDAEGRVSHVYGAAQDITETMLAQAAMQESEQRFRRLIEHAPEALVLLDPESGRFLYGNPAAQRLFALDAEALTRHGPVELSPPLQPDGQPTPQKARTYIDAALAGDTPVFEWMHRDAAGRDIPCEVRLLRIELGGRAVIRGSVLDISERKQAERRIERLNRTYALLSETNQAIVRETDTGALLETICRIAVEVGRFRLAWIGLVDAERRLRVAAVAGADADTVALLRGFVEGERPDCAYTYHALEHGRSAVCCDVAGDQRAANWREAALARGYRSLASLPIRVHGLVRGTFNLYADEVDFFDAEELRLLDELALDVGFALEVHHKEDERRRATERIQQLALYDVLTGLPNRALFLDRLKQALAAAQRRGRRGAVFFLDLDRFKEINDTRGHDVGDQVLIEVAARLKAVVREEETLARLGGDEFVALLPRLSSAAEAARVAERLLAALAEPLDVAGQRYRLSAGVGIAFFPDEGDRVEQLLRHADIAMYRAKAAGGGYCFYHPEMSAHLNQRLDLARRLAQALEQGRLVLHFQPQVRLPDGRPCGAEALLRWHDADLGWIDPPQIVALAEERGMIHALGEWVLGAACRQLAAWDKAGFVLPGRLAINVSARQLADPRFVDDALHHVRAAGLAPERIEFELTESGMMLDPARAVELIRALKDAGFAVAVDDFGTGYSSLAYLQRFTVDKLKLDLSFVHHMLDSAPSRAIVEAVLAMARGLDLVALAEGVETAAQAQALAALGYEQAQGFYFGRPLAADDFRRACSAPRPR
ncbi:MAG: hypothetical protein KatS3mg121_0600 [Gammaproteobacteria bacterium]|nr:MAG: hypothetical protein KatS3mg121_0600 [Gammaproteobacteria bacterium]